ncbi:MAG TPA: YfhO family protein, partial [Acidimicrobiales bacterium]|nr:YfhO family protein [Acidimicrobiales bacterium]
GPRDRPLQLRAVRRPRELVCPTLIGVVVAANLWSFRAALKPVAYLYDAPVHEAMVQAATKALDAGHLPFTTWFPDVGLGSAQYLHYQSLGSVLAGLAGTVIGADNAFRWALYLLVALWPIAVYWSGRIFGLTPGAAAVAAAISPLVTSFTGIAFERGAYSWIGGAEVWTQLFGMWALPFAWATTWRAFKDARFLWPAALLVGLTFAFHFLCGYLAFFGVCIMALIAQGQLRQRLFRGVVLLAGAVLSAAWVVVPLFLLSKWSAINEVLAETPYVRGYGARTELGWLFKGEIFDARRWLAVVSVLVLLGVIWALARWRREPLARAMVALLAACYLLSFGSTTWGALIDLVPAHADLYFRRFEMGTQLAGVYLAGLGVRGAWSLWCRLVANFNKTKMARAVAAWIFAVALAAWSWPAVIGLDHYDRADASTIATQRSLDATEGGAIAPLIAYVRSHGGGRAYAGLSSNWGQRFLVGYVPVYKYLVDQDVDEMTYVVPTTSLMLGPEDEFDEDNPADYSLYGIRYLFLPSGVLPPVPAVEVMVSGNYSLWRYNPGGYVELVEITGNLAADRADIGPQSLLLLDTVAQGQDWAVSWPGRPSSAAKASAAGVPLSEPLPAPGYVISVRPQLADGELSAEVDMHTAGTLLASVAFDPGWHAWVDGKAVSTEMLAPALVGVELSKGQHKVVLRYEGFAWYPELWLLGLVTLVVLYYLGERERRSGPVLGGAQTGSPGTAVAGAGTAAVAGAGTALPAP